MDIPLSSPSYIYGYNMSVIHNTYNTESILRMKENSVPYHTVCESVAMGESLVGNVPNKENVADLLKKSFMGKRGNIWSEIFSMIFMMTNSYQF